MKVMDVCSLFTNTTGTAKMMWRGEKVSALANQEAQTELSTVLQWGGRGKL